MAQETRLSIAIIDRRGDRTLQEAAAESGIPLGTLHRLEKGTMPDQQNFILAMKWLDVSPKDWWLYMESEVAK